MDKQYHYPGEELELFQDATNWKKYFAKKLKPYLKGDVLEVGAGLGATTRVLNDGSATSWTMLEPDEEMFLKMQAGLPGHASNVCVLQGTVGQAAGVYDAILYIDVLEHIEKDREELLAASARLRPGGHLIVLSPAFNFLYSEFDKAIGHFKRYRKKDLRAISPAGLRLRWARYLDALGFLASVMNKLVLHQSYPTKKQVQLWDKKLVPFSRFFDRLFFYSFGKTILAVWQKQKHDG